MESEVQTAIMQELQQLADKIDNHSESKDLLRSLEELEEENEALREQAREKDEHFEVLEEELVEQRTEADKYQKEVKKYEAEKKKVMEELAITDMLEYIDICRGMNRDNEELARCLRDVEERRK